MSESQRRANKKWRSKNRDKVNEQKKRNYKQTVRNAHNYKKQWTKEEEKMILDHNISDRELAEQLGRSVQAIQVRRSKLKANEI